MKLIYQAAMSPSMPGNVSGQCRTCGESSMGLHFKEWVKDTFTDHDKLHSGDIVCHACQFCFTDQNEPLSKIVGKGAPQRTRNYSHFVLDGQWIACSKGNKQLMLETIIQNPEVAIIAESGQKHIIFRARSGWWQFEELAMRPDIRHLSLLVDLINPMLTIFSKAEIESGNYSMRYGCWT